MKFFEDLGLGLRKPYFIVFILACFTTSWSESRAHHKVHNLALYPERHSWCQATPIRQEIAHAPECHTKTIDNVVCLGACFSYSVPRAQDDPVIPPYCDACRPTISAWKVITLNCTKPITGEPYQLARNVEIISNCSCVDCNDNTPRAGAGVTEGVDSAEDETSQELQDPLFDRKNNEVEEDDEDDDDKPMDELPVVHVPTLHKLKSVSAELKDVNKAADEEIMIKENKIPADDDHDHDSNLITKERERQRTPISISSTDSEEE